jgi:hypothetical protein
MVKTAVISTEVLDIWVDDEGILCVHAKDDAQLTFEHIVEAFEKYSELGFGPGKKKALELLTGKSLHTMPREGRAYAAEKGKDYFIASALVSGSPMMRYIVNFFNAVYKPGVPFKLFATEEEAKKWLRTFEK